jgi:hypothetical protein
MYPSIPQPPPWPGFYCDNNAQSPHGFLRARACQVFHSFSEIDFANMANIETALDNILACLQDDELPVRVQAAVALRCLLTHQHFAARCAEPHVTKIVGILLTLLNEAESDDLASVLDKLVELYVRLLCPAVPCGTFQCHRCAAIVTTLPPTVTHSPTPCCFTAPCLHRYEDQLLPHSAELLQSLIDQFGAFIANDLEDEEVTTSLINERTAMTSDSVVAAMHSTWSFAPPLLHHFTRHLFSRLPPLITPPPPPIPPAAAAAVVLRSSCHPLSTGDAPCHGCHWHS